MENLSPSPFLSPISFYVPIKFLMHVCKDTEIP